VERVHVALARPLCEQFTAIARLERAPSLLLERFEEVVFEIEDEELPAAFPLLWIRRVPELTPEAMPSSRSPELLPRRDVVVCPHRT
jgi:hypothetical protein